MKKVILLVLFALVHLPHPTSSYGQPTADELVAEVSNNISHEYVECYAYFMFVAEGARRSNNKELEDAYKTASDRALEYAVITAETGRSQEMAQKVTLARVEMSFTDMRKSIDNDISNISILAVKYAERCKYALEKPDEFTKEWGNKIFAKYGVPPQ